MAATDDDIDLTDQEESSGAEDELEDLEAKQDVIVERFKFWEEQERINQVLIPRVIRQHELLSEHIVEHENLPAYVSRAVERAEGEVVRAVVAEEMRKVRGMVIMIMSIIGIFP